MKVKVDTKTNISKLKVQDKLTSSTSLAVINSSKTDLDEQENDEQPLTATTLDDLKQSSSLTVNSKTRQAQAQVVEEAEDELEIVDTFDILPHLSTTRNNNLIVSISA